IGPYAVQRSRRSALYTDGGFRERAQPAAIAKFRPHLPPWDRFGIPEFVVRSEGLEPPRCYSLPPQGSASTNSATSASSQSGTGFCAGPHQRRRCNKSGMGGQGLPVRQIQEMGPSKLRASRSAAADRSRQHLLDFDRDPVAVDKDHAGGTRQGIGEDLDLVCFGGVEFDDATPAQALILMNRHRCGSQY